MGRLEVFGSFDFFVDCLAVVGFKSRVGIFTDVDFEEADVCLLLADLFLVFLSVFRLGRLLVSSTLLLA